MTYLAESVGPRASFAKLVGKSGLPGPRSPTALYTSLLAFEAWLHRLLPKLPKLLIELLLGCGDGYSSGVFDCCCWSCCCWSCCWSWLTDDVDDVRSRRAGSDVASAAKIPGTVGTVEMRRPWMMSRCGEGSAGSESSSSSFSLDSSLTSSDISCIRCPPGRVGGWSCSAVGISTGSMVSVERPGVSSVCAETFDSDTLSGVG